MHITALLAEPPRSRVSRPRSNVDIFERAIRSPRSSIDARSPRASVDSRTRIRSPRSSPESRYPVSLPRSSARTSIDAISAPLEYTEPVPASATSPRRPTSPAPRSKPPSHAASPRPSSPRPWLAARPLSAPRAARRSTDVDRYAERDRELWEDVANAGSDVTRTLSSHETPPPSDLFMKSKKSASGSLRPTPRRRRSVALSIRLTRPPGAGDAPPRRFLSYAFVWTGPTMSGFIVRVRDGLGAALLAADRAPRSPSLRGSVEQAVGASTMREPQELLAALVWLWRVDGREAFEDALIRHIRHVHEWRAAVGSKNSAVAALSETAAAFSLLELADNQDGSWWRRADFCALRSIAARGFDFRAVAGADNLARAATAEERGKLVSCAAMLVLLEIQDMLGGPVVATEEVLTRYVVELYCKHALRAGVVVRNALSSAAPWHSRPISCDPYSVPGSASNAELLLDAMGVFGGGEPRELRVRLREELITSAPPARHHKDGLRPPCTIPENDRMAELDALLRDKRKRVRLVACAGGGDPVLVVTRYVGWRSIDNDGLLDARLLHRALGTVVLMVVGKDELDTPRNTAVGVDVDRADRRAAALWCSRDEVRVRRLGVAQRAIRDAEDMRRYLHVPSLETYVALSRQHAPWASVSDVGYARGAWDGPIALDDGLSVARAMHSLVLLPVSRDAVFSVLDWELRSVSAVTKGRIRIGKSSVPFDAIVDKQNIAKTPVFTGARTDVYV